MSSTMTEQIELFCLIKCNKCGNKQFVEKDQSHFICRECHKNIDISECISFGITDNRETVKKDNKEYFASSGGY